MKRNTVVLAVLVAAILLTLTSCKLFDDLSTILDRDLLGPLGDNQFYALDVKTKKHYILTAKKLWEGKTCTIWAEERNGTTEVTKAGAKKFADKYDDEIRGKLIKAFSVIDGEQGFDILAYADSLTDSNGKLTILFLDIRDGYNGSAYVAGYFFEGDFYQQGKIFRSSSYSNGRDMIYVDTNPGLKYTEETYATFAHELQHLINYATRARNGAGQMDIWVNEGLSAWAEYLYYGRNPYDKWYNFIQDIAGTIARGNNFFVWGNHEANPDSILDEYSTVYLFFRWLYLQAADKELEGDIFKKIIASPHHDYRAVTEVAAQINPEWSNWGTLLGTWLAANCYPGSPYGYIGDEELMGNIRVNTISGTSISLYPGEGVYSLIMGDSFAPAPETSRVNIRYAGLVEDSFIVNASEITGNILLTYNANANNGDKTTETGELTGFSSVAPVRAQSRGGQAGRFTGPYVLDARDLLGRDREQELP